jgi:UDP:flavonoid glycosyltransferase YjiC (YdhE family)
VLAVKDELQDELLRRPSDGSTFVIGHVDYSTLFSHAEVIIHPGGIGTIGHALRAAVPMLIIPFVADQHYNAELSRQLGISRTVPADDRGGDRIIGELSALLGDPSYGRKVAAMAEVVGKEDGAVAACDLIERHTRDRAAAAAGRAIERT